jgi:hypothetical protein
LPLKTNPQKKRRALQFPTFDLLYAQMEPAVLSLPVGFYHFVQRNYSGLFLAIKLIEKGYKNGR